MDYLCMTGGLAQLGEHLLCKQGVVGSIPSSSTKRLHLITAMINQTLCAQIAARGIWFVIARWLLLFNNS